MLARLILLLVLVSPVVAATLWFSNNPGAVQIQWLGWWVETNMPVLLVSLLLLFTALFSLFRLTASLMGLPAKLGHSRKARGQEKGMTALLAALDAVAASDIGEGHRLGAEAAKLLGSPALAARLDRLMPRPLVPPVAETGRDAGKKRKIPPRIGLLSRLSATIVRPKGRAALIGTPAVSAKAVAAPVQSPTAGEKVSTVVTDGPALGSDDLTLFAAKVRAAAWDEALVPIDQAVAAGRMPAATGATLKSSVLEAKAAQAGDTDSGVALQLAQEAIKANPGFLPAVLHVIRLGAATGRRGEAEAALAAAWRRTPARPLLAACRDLWKDDDPQMHLKRLEGLIEANPNHPESHLALGEAAVAAECWGVARRHLVAAVKAAPCALGYRLMAEVEEKESGGTTGAAEIWRRKEQEAPPAPAWRCGGCGATSAEWSITCPSCDAIAAIDWAARA